MTKKILDVCCGGRMAWFNKNHPLATYMDLFPRTRGCIKQQPNFEVNPDMVGDFRDIPFYDNTFKLVLFDPPHASIPGGSIIAKKYGTLNMDTWKEDIRRGFEECMRVLEPFGILIFKWNEVSISVREVIDVIGTDPLFGHTTAKSGKTKWMCFMKIPEDAA